MKKLTVPYYKQLTEYTCGPASLRMVLKYFNHTFSERALARAAKTTRPHGTSHHGMVRAVHEIGFSCRAHERATVREVKKYIKSSTPVIINYRHTDGEGHYAVIVGYAPSHFLLHDPYGHPCARIKTAALVRAWWDRYHNKRSTRWLMAIQPKSGRNTSSHAIQQ